jgi:hypothetical protein
MVKRTARLEQVGAMKMIAAKAQDLVNTTDRYVG